MDVIRSVRIHKIAVADVVASYIGFILLIHYWTKKPYTDPLVLLSAFSFIPVAIATHYVFGIPTEGNRILGINK